MYGDTYLRTLLMHMMMGRPVVRYNFFTRQIVISDELTIEMPGIKKKNVSYKKFVII